MPRSHAIEIRFGKDHHTDPDDHEHREPTESQLERPPRRVRRSDVLVLAGHSERAERPGFSSHRAALVDHPASDGQGVADDLSARMQSKIAVDDEGRTADASEHVE